MCHRANLKNAFVRPATEKIPDNFLKQKIIRNFFNLKKFHDFCSVPGGTSSVQGDQLNLRPNYDTPIKLKEKHRLRYLHDMCICISIS